LFENCRQKQMMLEKWWKKSLSFRTEEEKPLGSTCSDAGGGLSEESEWMLRRL
jgi:hypothetical protein